MDGHRHLAVSVTIPHGPKAYAKGGLAHAAQDVAGAGVGGDTMIVHVNKPEFDQMRQQWGDPTINPHTQMPQFTPFYKEDWFAPLAAVVGSATGLGGTIGDTVGGAIGLDAGSTASNALGSALLGGGVGALSNGGQGALLGALAGGATPYVSNMLTGSGTGGSGLLGNLLGGSSSGGGDKGSLINPISSDSSSSSSSSGGSKSDSGGLAGILGNKSTMATLIGGLYLANMIGKATQGPDASTKAGKAKDDAMQVQFNKPMPQMSFQRQAQTLTPQQYLTYGQRPAAQQQQFTGNQFPQATQYKARGGLALAQGGIPNFSGGAHAKIGNGHLVQGPGDGRSDEIPARLSQNEYVVDSESVGLLGNGDPASGAKKLDAMRVNLRKHKGKALAKGNFSPNAKSPEAYMRGGKV